MLLAVLLSLAPLLAQVSVKKGAVVYHGSVANTSAPASIDETRVRDATPEWKKLQAEGIDPDSAKGRQLVVQLNNRIREAVRAVACNEGRDMVTRKDDVTDAQGKQLLDLTDKVVDKVSS